MKTSASLSAALALAMAGAASPALAAWSKNYVVSWYEPAMYFGGESKSADAPGTDCPKGANPDINWVPLLIAGGMPKEKAERYNDPEFRSNGGSLYSVIPTRAPGGVNVYKNPEAIPDPGLYTVEGDVAYGFDLDGDPSTGFLSVDGKQRGIDNAFYKASGCILRFRGPRKESASFLYSMEDMRNGAYTIVLVLSGEGADPTNDPNARLGIYLAKDKVVKDPQGLVTPGYTYRINPDPRFQTVLEVAVTNGVIEAKAPQKVTMRDHWSPGFFPRELVLEQSRLRLATKPDGSLEGFIGGYRDWREHYRGNSGNGRDGSGAIHEVLGHFQLPAWWRAMKRHADGLPDPVTGEKRGISTVYAIDALPSWVVTPDAREQVKVARLFGPEPGAQAAAPSPTPR